MDLIIRNAAVLNGSELAVVDIGIAGTTIAAISPSLKADARELDAAGCLVISGMIETHIHLDKTCILDRCRIEEGTVAEAVRETAAAKRGFTVEDVYARGKRTLERCIAHGTMHMRTHVELDPGIGMIGFEAISQLARDYAWAMDIECCVFPQEGLLNDPGTEELLVEACENGADLIGGCPYTDTDTDGHVARIFAIAERFDVDIDFHLDFDLDPTWMRLDEVIRQTEKYRWGGRVAVGHVTKLSAVDRATLGLVGKRLADAGVAVTAIPTTDLFLMGRDHDHNVPRGVTPVHRLAEQGVTCSLATNNVLNPFTPFGDCSLVRLANLYANVAQVGQQKAIASCLDLVTTAPARLMQLDDYGVAIGHPADLVVLDCETAFAAVAEVALPLMGFKRGRKSFSRPRAAIHRPHDRGIPV